MKEHEFIKIINSTLSDNSYLGDDCAYLEDFGLFVTHDTMVENVHFSLKYASAEQIGYKAVVTNLSDLASSLAKPLYVTVSLSLPARTENAFLKGLYQGINAACNEYDVKVVGGDITGSDKVVISICAIGKKQSDYFAKRDNAKVSDVIVVTGSHGSSAAGLNCFKQGINDDYLKSKHLLPKARFDAVDEILKYINTDIACMDTSDGLFDALKQISENSNVTAMVDFDKVPSDKQIEQFDNFQDFILFGGEDYELLFTMPETLFEKLDKNIFVRIGKVEKFEKQHVIIKGSNLMINEIMPLPMYDHFGLC